MFGGRSPSSQGVLHRQPHFPPFAHSSRRRMIGLFRKKQHSLDRDRRWALIITPAIASHTWNRQQTPISRFVPEQRGVESKNQRRGDCALDGLPFMKNRVESTVFSHSVPPSIPHLLSIYVCVSHSSRPADLATRVDRRILNTREKFGSQPLVIPPTLCWMPV